MCKVGQEQGVIPAGMRRKNLLGRGVSQFHDLLKDEQGKMEAVSKLKKG